jgi:HrpA-like RNA helicase
MRACTQLPTTPTHAGAVLVFLPSWQSIQATYDAMLESAQLAERSLIFVLHSSLPISEQQEVFEHAPPGALGPAVHALRARARLPPPGIA